MAPLKHDLQPITIQAFQPYNTAHAGAVFLTHREVIGRTISDHDRRIARDLATKPRLSDLQRDDYIMKSNYLLNIYPFRPLSRDALEALKPSSHKIFGDRVTISKDPDSAWTVVEAKEPGAKGNLGPNVTGVSGACFAGEVREKKEEEDWEVVEKVDEEGWLKL